MDTNSNTSHRAICVHTEQLSTADLPLPVPLSTSFYLDIALCRSARKSYRQKAINFKADCNTRGYSLYAG